MTKQYHNHGTRHEEMMFPGGTVARDLTTIDALNGRRQQYVQMNVANSNDRHNIVAKASLVNDNPPEMFDNSLLTYSGITA